MMEKKIIWISMVCLIVLSTSFVYADTIYTKDGRVIDVNIINEINGTIWYEVQGGRVGIARDSILKIEGGFWSTQSQPVIYKESDSVAVKKEDTLNKQPMNAVDPTQEQDDFDSKMAEMRQSFVDKGLLTIVDDVPTAEAIKKFNEKMEEIAKNSPPPLPSKDADFNQIMEQQAKFICEHLPEVQAANQIKVDAFADLLKRKPELIDKMIKIEGVFGNWQMNPEDLKENTIEELKKQYNCN